MALIVKQRLKTVAAVLALLGATAVPFLTDAFRVGQLSQVLITAIAVMGLNLLTGFTGQVSVGHSAFFGVGAYVTAILTGPYGWGLAASIPVAVAAGALVGALVGIPSERIKGVHLALVTVVLAAALPAIIRRFEGTTGGSQGLRGTKLTVRNSALQPDQLRYLVILGAFILIAAFVLTLSRSAVGRQLRAIGDHEVAAITLGIRPYRLRVLTFAASAAVTAFAGGLFILSVGYISPSTSYVTLTGAVMFLTALVIGGRSVVWGPLLGAAVVELVPAQIGVNHPEFAHLFFAAAILVLLLTTKEGLFRATRWLKKPARRAPLPAPNAERAPLKSDQNERQST